MTFVIPEGLAPEVYPLAWLVGRWAGRGVLGYPGVEETAFTQEVEFDYDGGPYLGYSATICLGAESSDATGAAGTPNAGATGAPGVVWSTERGFWRIPPERPDGLDSELSPVEVLLADPAGHVDVYLGATGNGRLDLASDLIARTVSGAEIAAATRMYGLVEGDLMWAIDLAAFGQPMQSYAAARLSRVLDSVAP